MILEAVDPNGAARRAAAGLAAGREVQASANSLDQTTVTLLLERLGQLKRELQGIIAAGGSDFRTFTAQRLIQEVERLIADATRDIHNASRGTYASAAAIGTAAADEPIKAARISLDASPAIDTELVASAFELTGDLLTVPMQQFRNQVVQGIRKASTLGTGSPYVELAKNIGAAGFDNAAFMAERIVRTEQSRVLNQATFARLSSLAAQMPFLRKGWRSSKDARTRRGHREAGQTYARGSGIAIATLFRVNVYDERRLKMAGRGASAGVMSSGGPKLLGTALLRFPSDPEATPAGRLAAGATIMCRCNAFTDFDLADLKAWSTTRSGGVVVPDPTPLPDERTPIAKAPRKPRPPKPLETAEQIRAKVLAAAVNVNPEEITTKAAFGRAYDTWHNARVKVERLDAEGGRSSSSAGANGEFYDRAVKALDEAVAALEAARAAMNKAKGARDEAIRKALEVPAAMRRKIRTRFAKGAETFGDGWSQSYDAQGRPLPRVYTGGDKVRARYAAAAKELERLVGYGSFTAPKLHDWQKGSQFERVTIDRARDLTNPKQLGSRAYANQFLSQNGSANSINMGPNDDARVVVHELGHILEFNSPEIKNAALAFLEARTKGERPRRLSEITGNSSYRDHEVARPDKFMSPYVGKDYGGTYTEVISMGLEYLYAEPVKFAREDPDYFDFMVDLLRGRFRKPGGS